MRTNRSFPQGELTSILQRSQSARNDCLGTPDDGAKFLEFYADAGVVVLCPRIAEGERPRELQQDFREGTTCEGETVGSSATETTSVETPLNFDVFEHLLPVPDEVEQLLRFGERSDPQHVPLPGR